MTAPSFSVVIPTRDRPERLAACLEHLARMDYPTERYEVIVVDDGSAVPPTGIVARFRDRLALLLISQPPSGPARARNAGAARAGREYLAFTDDDCRPAPGWLAALAARLVEAPERPVGGRTLNALPESLCSSASQALCDYLYAYYNADPDAARLFTSNNLALSAKRFREVGGFDPSFPLAAGEDRDICDRLVRTGPPMRYVREAVVHHAHPLTLPRFIHQHFRYGQGAFRFHTARAARLHERVAVEPPRFYVRLVGSAWSRSPSGRTAALSFLLAASQVANAAGFSVEALRSARLG